MHHPIQMKPADSENRNGKLYMIFIVLFSKTIKVLNTELCLASISIGFLYKQSLMGIIY